METVTAGGLILGIESSCDETAAAVVRGGTETLSNVISTQMAMHAVHGGVVPEIASREHLRQVVPVVRAALSEAGVGYGELDAVAVTEGPGLAGALLVGITFAKSLAWGLGKPLIAVNHLEGHIHSVLLHASSAGAVPVGAPLLALVVSGGHTHLYLATQADEAWAYQNVGRTVDDAAGEAYDKVAKLLGLPYPGGPWMDALAAHGDPAAVPFSFGPIRPRTAPPPDAPPRFDFSFSGIKTAALRYVQRHDLAPAAEARRVVLQRRPGFGTGLGPGLGGGLGAAEIAALYDRATLGLIASFQAAVVGVLLRQCFAAAERFGAGAVLVSGGVAANRELRQRFAAEGGRRGLPVLFPSVLLATDNAAMIAAAAWPKLRAGSFAGEDLTASPQLRLG